MTCMSRISRSRVIGKDPWYPRKVWSSRESSRSVWVRRRSTKRTSCEGCIAGEPVTLQEFQESIRSRHDIGDAGIDGGETGAADNRDYA